MLRALFLLSHSVRWLTLAWPSRLQNLPAASITQFPQLLSSFEAPALSGCSQQDFCLFAIPGNSLASQIKLGQFDLRRGIARSDRRPQSGRLHTSILRRFRRPTIRDAIRSSACACNGGLRTLRMNLPRRIKRGRVLRPLLSYSRLRFVLEYVRLRCARRRSLPRSLSHTRRQ